MNKSSIIGIVKLLVSLFFLIGFESFLKPCGPKEDGTWMHCHQAGQALCAIAAGLLIISLIGFLLKGKGAALFAVLPVVLGLLAIVLPGHVISLCMMPDMRCRAITAPAGLIFGLVMIVLGIVGFVMRDKEKK